MGARSSLARRRRAEGRVVAEEQWDVVVVGAGQGGLACGAYLAASGLRVLVLEQHPVAGGNTHVFRRRSRYEFDVGTHYLGNCGADGVLPQIYHGLGVADRLRFRELDPDGFDHIRLPPCATSAGGQ